MEENEKIGQILSESSVSAPVGLLERILFSVIKRERRAAVLRFGIFAIASVGTAILFVISLGTANSALYQSGVLQIFSLAFSDFQTVVANWHYFVMSVASALPILPIVFLLLCASILSVVVTLAIANLKNFGRIKTYHLKHV